MDSLTFEAASALLRYEPETGHIYWRVQKGRAKSGDRAGSFGPKPYRTIRINKRAYLEHRVVWLLVNGEWPNKLIDHINGVHDDNRIENLRDVSQSMNLQNIKGPKCNNKLGVLGVTKVKDKFLSQIRYGGSLHVLGFFETADVAHEAYMRAKSIHHIGGAMK